MEPQQSERVFDKVRGYLGIGSNIGDRLTYIERAIQLIGHLERTEVKAVAPVFETKPHGYLEQDDFLNTVVAIDTEQSPLELLRQLQAIEQALGRERTIHWGPRTVDIDILFYGQQIIQTEELVVPHPRLHERDFVIVPMCHLDCQFVHPTLGETIDSLRTKLTCNTAKEWEDR